jgi:hypothetical protein
MAQTKHVNKSVNRRWRKEVYRLCRKKPQELNKFLTDLFTVSAAHEQLLKADAQKQKLREGMADVWAAARLGFSGAKALTLGPGQRSQRFLLCAAFKHGQAVRNAYRDRFASPVGHEPNGAESAVKKAP